MNRIERSDGKLEQVAESNYANVPWPTKTLRLRTARNYFGWFLFWILVMCGVGLFGEGA